MKTRLSQVNHVPEYFTQIYVIHVAVYHQNWIMSIKVDLFVKKHYIAETLRRIRWGNADAISGDECALRPLVEQTLRKSIMPNMI